jgi:4-hydroxybenzoate polyprenyltransferase/phosphoserine phosphatase
MNKKLPNIPLAVDLDGTLIKTDLLYESFLCFIKKDFFSAITILKFIFLSKKAELKRNIAQNVTIDVTTLPYDYNVIDYIKREKSTGRKIVLATASHSIYAEKIAAHLQFFDQVLATENDLNLSAKNKANKLVELYGEKGFDYIGNSMDDIPVWEKCHKAIIVNPHRGVEQKARKICEVESVIKTDNNKWRALVNAIRLHQWAKNLLLFVPLFASHQILNPDKIALGFLAFLLFGLCASSVYLFNDLLDIQDDRHHKTKRHRPFASATLSIPFGLMLVPTLLLIVFVGSFFLLPIEFIYVLTTYYALTLLYSFYLKRIVVMDVLGLAMLYTLRIIAGTFVFELSLTFWMLAFSMFIFLSLALVKRYTELIDARNQGILTKARGRGYYPNDLEMIASLGAASGYIAVMVLALYIQDQTTASLYRLPQVIWLACPLLLFWISRVWLLAHRGQMHDDPVVFAIKDKTSLLVGLIFGVIFWLAA